MRFIDANEGTLELLNNVIKTHFPELVNCRIKVLMDSKKKMDKGNFEFASIKKASEIERCLTSDDINDDGYDLIMRLDDNVFTNVTTEDKEKILFHELCHVFYDSDAKNPYKLVGHDFTGFVKETEMHDDIFTTWDRITEIAKSIYDE